MSTSNLPAFIADAIAAADESHTATVAEGNSTVARLDRVIVNLVDGDAGELSWYTFPTVEEAAAKYTEVVAMMVEVEQYLAHGGDIRALALSRAKGIPLEVAEQMVQVYAGTTCDHPECQPGYQPEQVEQPAAVRAIGRATVPGVMYASGSVPEPPTGMYL
jgi:hypothetical protein